MPDQHEIFQNAILKKRARVEEIDLILHQPIPKGFHPTGRRQLIEEKLYLEGRIAEIAAEDARLLEQRADAQPFQWERLDQRLISPKVNELAEEMHKRTAEAERRAAFETAQAGNSAGYLPRLVSLHENFADEWAKRLYDAHCETWTQQNQTVTPAFVRAVRDRAIRPLLAGREATVRASLEDWAERTGQVPNPMALRDWKLRMDRLTHRWDQQLETAAAEAEYAARRADRGPQLPSKPVSLRPLFPGMAGVWHEFHDEFMALAHEERATAPGNVGDRWLTVHVSYENPQAELGEYWLTQGIGESFRTRFDALATRAGIALNVTRAGESSVNIWVHHVFQDLLEHQSKLLFAASERGGVIERLCEASAVCCARLEIRALEAEGGGRQRENVTDTSSPTRKHPGRNARLPSDFVDLAGTLWREAAKTAHKIPVVALQEMAVKLDRAGYGPPADYLEGRYAADLRTFNSHNSNSKTGPIKTWADLVSHGDKDHLRGMRRMLSRCAIR